MSNKIYILFITFALALSVGCDSNPQDELTQQPAQQTVRTIKLQPTDIILEQTWPARVSANRTAEIRPQVGGIIKSRLFVQGSEVRANQPLFQLDEAPFKADVEMATAVLTKAQAAYHQLQLRAARLSQLQSSGAVSRQDIDDAKANATQAAASVAEATAALNRKKLDLAYTTVRAPIDGRIDQEFVTEGALVSAGNTQALATVQQINDVYIDARLPAVEVNKLMQDASADNRVLSLLDDNGQSYGVKPTILFSGINVNNETGDVVLRAVTNNPGKKLIPGMYVRLKITQTINKNGLLIPVESVQRKQGEAFAWYVDSKGMAYQKKIQLGEQTGQHFIIKGGLKVGENIVVEGQDKLQEGIAVINNG